MPSSRHQRRRSTRQRNIEERRALQGYVQSLPYDEFCVYVTEHRDHRSTDSQALPDYDYMVCKRLFGDDTDAGTAWLQQRTLAHNLALIDASKRAHRAANPVDWVGLIVYAVFMNTLFIGGTLAVLYPVLPTPTFMFGCLIGGIMWAARVIEVLLKRAPA